MTLEEQTVSVAPMLQTNIWFCDMQGEGCLRKEYLCFSASL